MEGKAGSATTVKKSQKFSIGRLYSAYLKKIETLNIPQKFKKPNLILGCVAALIIVLIYFFLSPSGVDGKIPTYTVKKEKFLVSITESGEIRAKNSISISSPRVRGNLKIIFLVPEGTYVKANDTVVKFDPTEAITALKDAEAKLEISLSDKEKLIANQKSTMTRAESDLKSAELTYELSKLNLEQMKFEAEMKRQEANLQRQRDELSYLKAQQDFKSQKIINQSELNKVDIDVRQRKADLERAKKDLAMLTLTAPAEGLVVYELNWSTGRKMQIGDTPWSGMTILSLPDLSSMESITSVNEVDISKIKKGLNVKIKLDAFQDSVFAGVIGNVASLGKSKDKNGAIKIFEIGVDIKSKSEKLKPGMTTSNKIIINEIPNVLFVPQEAVFEKEGKKVVYVKDGSRFDEKVVETGEKNENHIIITKGIKDGDEVALRDPTIKIEEIKKKDEPNSSVTLPAGK
jgi:HlyD family secretion protein